MKTIYLFILLLLGQQFIQAQTRMADSLILVEVFNSLDGPNWNNPENWLTAEPLEEWRGIRITNDRVTVLEIIQQAANGPFPDVIIGLDQLNTFEIRQGTISGEIPVELVQLTQLKRFILSSTGIGGDIKNIWSQFDNLGTLGLSQNNLTGTLPDIGDDLTLLTFQGNQLTGPIPASWEGNPLGNLNLSFNNLTGSFDIFSTWPSLFKLDLDNNDWEEQTLPLWIDDNLNLDDFSCSNCNLVGDIPEEIDFSNHTELGGLFLHNNRLSGDITKLFPSPDANDLLYMNVGFNNFSGEFPAHLVKSFSRIIIQGNQYTSTTPFGDIDLSVCNMKSNDFTYETLVPLLPNIVVDTLIPVDYSNQNNTLGLDTIEVTEPSMLVIEAGDEHPNTNYEWYRNNVLIDDATGSELVLDIIDNSLAGSYYCIMSNPDFPELNLRRNIVRINIDLTVSTKNLEEVRFTISPNPASDYILIDAPFEFYGSGYQVFSIDGKKILDGILMNENKIDLNKLMTGTYLLRMITEEGIFNQKFVRI